MLLWQALIVSALFFGLYTYLRPSKANDIDRFLLLHASIGLNGKFFTWARALLQSLWSTRDWLFEGYEAYSKHGFAFVLPSIDRDFVLVVPPRQIKKVYNLPDHVLDAEATQRDTIQMKYTIRDRDVIYRDFHYNVVRNQLTRKLAYITPIIAEEARMWFDTYWGTSNQWKSVALWDCCLQLVAGASNGVFFGPPLCRDMKFLDSVRNYAESIFSGGFIINLTPKPFKVLVGTMVSRYSQFRFDQSLKFCLPIITQRLEDTAKLKGHTFSAWEPPEDALQWIIDEAYAANDPAQLEPSRIARRLLVVNSVSLHTTSWALQNVILDLFSTDPALGYAQTLRQECKAALADAGGHWTRSAVQDLKLVDSTIRESMRVSPFSNASIFRTIVHPEGIIVDNSKTRVPPGVRLALPVESIHRDDNVYANASQFNPFRFTQLGEIRNIADDIGSDDENDGISSTDPKKAEAKPKATATLDDAFLSFGFGKHACPGRFFAINELKILVADLLLNYDVETLTQRPRNVGVAWLYLPSSKARIRIRCIRDSNDEVVQGFDTQKLRT